MGDSGLTISVMAYFVRQTFSCGFPSLAKKDIDWPRIALQSSNVAIKYNKIALKNCEIAREAMRVSFYNYLPV